MPAAMTTEKAFEESIEADLLANGYAQGDPAQWDRTLSLDRVELFAFLEATQPHEWAKLQTIHGDKRDLNFLARLTKELDNRGTLDVLRHGIVDYGVRFKLAYFRPATTLNAEAMRLYNLNRLTVYRQIHFSAVRPHDSVDMVLSVNGLPVVTLELKNHFTGQTAANARKQFIKDRDKNELLFSFRKRALVHFAVDPDKVKEVLTTEYKAGEDPDETAEDVITRRMEARRSHHKNLSFFAFTATPKPKTLQVFGKIGEDGKPHPMHHYSMRQAIEEGFILDVLKNYVTYKRFFALSKQIEDDPRVDKKVAARAIARFVNLHPHNIAQKVEIIVEHFRQSVMLKIGGRAKALVVIDSRLSAVKYKEEVDEYLKEKGYHNIKALVAFSGTVKDEYDLEHTEAEMNGFGERELPERFQGDDYRLLLVAEKYQTGFDQPLLHTMYVDKRLAGVRAVQTLSRLNRTYPGKEDTFVLDFVNAPEEIQAAFQPYYGETTIDQATDPNQLYDLKAKLEAFDVTRQQEIEAFAQIFFNPRNRQSANAHAGLHKTLDEAVIRYKAISDTERQEYKSLLASFLRMYSFLSQVMPFTDNDQLFFEQIERDMSSDPELALQAQHNSLENFKYPFDAICIDRVIDRMEQNQEITDRIMEEEGFSAAVKDYLIARVYRRLRQAKAK